jgi:hypothetical protein
MSQQRPSNELLAPGVDRRRVPRYSCNGHAKITSLPLNGILLSGTIRDLGMGGCCIENIETISPFDLGARTEILVKVNSWFFRAMSHIKAVRDRSGISVEFMHLSAGGHDMLAELIADLESPRIGVTRPKRDSHSPRLLSWNTNSPAEPNPSLAIEGTIVPAESAEVALAENRQGWDQYCDPEAAVLDLFA